MKAPWGTQAALIALAALALLAGSARLVKAQVLTLEAIDSGWYDQSGNHLPENTIYFVGRVLPSPGEFHNFFVFDLSGITLPILSAQLRLFHPTNGYNSPDPSETYTLFDVSTPIPTLVAGGTGLTGVFADLGSGVSYGSGVFSAADVNSIVPIGLNAAALADLNGAAGGLFALGGAVTSLRPNPGPFPTPVTESVFGSASAANPRHLVLTLIPEPGTLALLGSGTLILLGCGWRRRRRAA